MLRIIFKIKWKLCWYCTYDGSRSCYSTLYIHVLLCKSIHGTVIGHLFGFLLKGLFVLVICFINYSKVSFLLIFVECFFEDGCNGLKVYIRWRTLSHIFVGFHCLFLPLVKEVQAAGVSIVFPGLTMLREFFFS
jgi:hypothetical protein